jgi:hypothetical protein
MDTDTMIETEGETETKTKLDAGRQNPVQTTFEFQADDAVPFDATALYSHLLEQAEQQYPCGSTEDVVTIFEAEFASAGAVPDLVTTTVADRLIENGIADAPPGDDLKQDALVTFFVDEYTRAFAADPDGLPDPRGVSASTSRPDRDGILPQLRQRLASLLNGLEK